MLSLPCHTRRNAVPPLFFDSTEIYWRSWL